MTCDSLFASYCGLTRDAVKSKIEPEDKILITGGTGVVGLHICGALLAAGVKPNNLLLTYFSRNPEELKPYFPQVNFLRYYDLKNISDQKFKAIFHCATYGQPLKYTSSKLDTLELNTSDQFFLLSMLDKQGCYGFISSSDVYSGNANLPLKESDKGVSDPWSERACYFEGKRAGEAIVSSSRSDGVDAKAFRLALGYGAGFRSNDERVLYQFVKAAIQEKVIYMRDEGKAMRTYGSLVDCSRMILLGQFSGSEVVYNVGGKSRLSILELAERVAAVAGANVIKGPPEPKSAVLKEAPNDVWLDLSRVLDEFDIETETLTKGLQRVFEWARLETLQK